LNSKNQKATAEAPVPGGGRVPRRRLVLKKEPTSRERHLVALVALARYLTTAQLHRLALPDRHVRTAERTLDALAGLGPQARASALLRRVIYQRYDGSGVLAWAVTQAGWTVATKLLGPLREPSEDIGHEFLEHTVQLNELFTRLFEPAAPLPKAKRAKGGRNAARDFARADSRQVRWVSSDGARLPWKDYDMRRGGAKERVIQPDAVLELSKARRRLFLECEMGTHTVVPVSPDKTGATLAKATRYENYLNGFADSSARRTFYQAQYPDGFEPEVLFLVLEPGRASFVNEALATWRERVTRAPAIRALTFAEASTELRAAAWSGTGPATGPAIGPTGGPAAAPDVGAGPTLEKQDALLLSAFCTEALQRLQGARHQIRALAPEARASLRLVEPAYPEETRAVQELLSRLTAHEGAA
jgi:hypothetical protein